MTPGSHARGDEPLPRRTRSGWNAWRIGTPAVVLLVGGLLTISATNSEGTDLRPGRFTDLASLVETEADEYDALEGRLNELTADVEQLTRAVKDRTVNRYHRRIARMEDPAGLTPRTGPGVTVTLSDAPEEVINDAEVNLNLLVVHQQDIQAVVNAMWSGGAEAITVQGQRIVSTTGIKCEGNAVQLQGIPYSQPYVIEAVGDQSALLLALEKSDYLQVYREQSADPEIAVGWDVELDDQLQAPAYDGLLDLTYAQPIR